MNTEQKPMLLLATCRVVSQIMHVRSRDPDMSRWPQKSSEMHVTTSTHHVKTHKVTINYITCSLKQTMTFLANASSSLNW